MAQEYHVLSNFGVRYVLLEYINDKTVPASATVDDEIGSVLSCDIGTFSKEVAKRRTLNGNGWETVTTLGNSAEDGTFECVRDGVGDPYAGVAGSSTYTKIKDWFMKATANAGKSSPKALIEILPRGDDTYEGTCFFVVPNQWSPGTRDTESGQEYSFTVTPFGPQIPVTVTYTPATGETGESWAFAKAGA